MRAIIAFLFLAVVAAGLLVAPGCVGELPYEAPFAVSGGESVPNPVFLADSNPERVWETVVDVVSDYFKIEREEPVRQIGGVLTEGRLDTFPEVGSTLLEPWRGDSAGVEERLESTLQSIRRYAQVKVAPTQGGYWVDVAVFKELEDVIRPAHSTAGDATFRNDSSLARVTSPGGDEEINRGWIPLGRDGALESQIVAELQSRLAPAAHRTPSVPAY